MAPALLGTSALNGSGIATLTTSSLGIGVHIVTAAYGGSNDFAASVSSQLSITVTGVPDYSVVASPASLIITRGSTGTTTLTLTPVNGYKGTVILSCGSQLPLDVSCTFAPASLVFSSASSIPQATMLTISTQAQAALSLPARPGTNGAAGYLVVAGLPAGMLCLLARRRLCWSPLLALVAFAALAGIAGCGSSNPLVNDTPAGSYTVPISLTDGTVTHPLSLSITVQ